MNFTRTKNGYSEKEVDEYISLMDLNNKKIIAEKNCVIDEMKVKIEHLEKQEKSIAVALTAAVERAKEIEMSSSSIYKLKIEQLTILYSKWERLLNEMVRKYPDIKDVTNVKEDINKLKSSIKSALKDDFNIDLITKNPITDPIRVLLSRLPEMRSNASKRDVRKVKTIERKGKVSASDKTELFKLEEKTNQIKPIVSLGLDKDDDYENLVDKFLDSDESDDKLSQALFKFPDYSNNENQFDLNEAINPTEDLEEIMKSFDFYGKKKR